MKGFQLDVPVALVFLASSIILGVLGKSSDTTRHFVQRQSSAISQSELLRTYNNEEDSSIVEPLSLNAHPDQQEVYELPVPKVPSHGLQEQGDLLTLYVRNKRGPTTSNPSNENFVPNESSTVVNKEDTQASLSFPFFKDGFQIPWQSISDGISKAKEYWEELTNLDGSSGRTLILAPLLAAAPMMAAEVMTIGGVGLAAPMLFVVPLLLIPLILVAFIIYI